MPTLQKKLLERWNETKDREDISLEEYIKSNTSIYETYQKMNQGKVLTFDMIAERLALAEYHDVGIGGATPIIHTPTATKDDGAVAMV